jgi:molybdate transport system substrate-binding protein
VSSGRRLAAALVVPPVLLALLLGTAGCGGGGDTRLTVFAAASLTGPFDALARQFESDHPGVRVVLSFAGSSDLAQQIRSGAPADVFASAAETDMDRVAGDVTGRTDFARNTLEIAVPPGNPAHVTGLADLARTGVKVAVCQARVPCGAVAVDVLRNAGVEVHPVTEEVDVKSVLAKVTLGEVDAGLVYVTDVRAAGDKVRGVPIPVGVDAVTTYPIAEVRDSAHATLAREFVGLVLSDHGRRVLADAGFAEPR